MSSGKARDVRPEIRKVRLKETFSTSELLAHAEQQARERGFEDFLIIDVVSHHYEFDHWSEIADYDMRTGRHAGNPKIRLRPIEVIRRDGQVYLRID